MTRDEFIDRVAGDTDRTAQDALGWLVGQGADIDTDVYLVIDVANALSQNRRLSERAQAHRLESLLWCHPPPPHQVSPIAHAARRFPANLRMAVANAIPVGARLDVYGSHRQSTTNRAEDTADAPAPVAIPDHEASGAPESDPRGLGYSTVLLLAHRDRQDANRTLLKSAGLDPMPVESAVDLERVLATSTDICGCAIDRSALAVLDRVAQETLFKTLAEYSSFLAIRVHEAPGLSVPRDRVSLLIKTARQLATLVPHDAVSFRSAGTIQEAELSFFQNAAKLLQAHESASFVLGELTPAEVQLLVAAARARMRAGSFDPGLDAEPLTVRFLTGGRSEAKLATVVCGNTPTFVAKITTKDRALDEMLRFRTFVQPLNDELSLECHLHGRTAVILSRLSS